jgi:beta-xylosidase
VPRKKVSNLRARSLKGSAQITGTSSARSLSVSRESFEVTVSGGSTFARVKLKEIDGMAPQDVERAV